MFGAPLAEGRPYRWGRGDKLAVFTWLGCTLRVAGLGAGSVAYVSGDTPMAAYVNTHVQLEARRDHAAALLARAAGEATLDGGGPYTAAGGGSAAGAPLAQGPRVLVCGAADCGKSALCAILVAYAVRVGRAPLFVELDPALVSASAVHI